MALQTNVTQGDKCVLQSGRTPRPEGRSVTGTLSAHNINTTGRSGDRIPVGTRFFAPSLTGSDVQPASYTMGTGSLPGVKRPGRGVDHPPHLAPVKERAELYIYSLSGPS
jgi:hypothetical protein